MLVKTPTASSAQMSRNVAEQVMAAAAQYLRGNNLALMMKMLLVPKMSSPITAKSAGLQRISWLNCIAMKGMSKSEQETSAAQPNAAPRKRVGFFCVITTISTFVA